MMHNLKIIFNCDSKICQNNAEKGEAATFAIKRYAFFPTDFTFAPDDGSVVDEVLVVSDCSSVSTDDHLPLRMSFPPQHYSHRCNIERNKSDQGCTKYYQVCLIICSSHKDLYLIWHMTEPFVGDFLQLASYPSCFGGIAE